MKTLRELSVIRSGIEQLAANMDSDTVLNKSESDLLLEIKRLWFDPLGLSENWDSTNLDLTEVSGCHNLFCYHALARLYENMATDTDQPGVFDRLKNEYYQKYKEEFNMWRSIGFPYTFDSGAEPSSYAIGSYTLRRV